MCDCANQIKSWIDEYGQKPENAITLLQLVQAKYGYLPRQAIEYISENSEITLAQLYGVATFYSQFRLSPTGKHKIRVCNGTACHVKGSMKIHQKLQERLALDDEHETTKDMSFTLEKVSCLGACGLASVVVIDEDVYGQTDAKKIIQEIEDIYKKDK